jgi:hypothetical protein
VIRLGTSAASGGNRGSINTVLLGLTLIHQRPSLPPSVARRPEKLRSLFGLVWEFGANFLFLVAGQSSQPIRARIANFPHSL